jgi:PPOX class probable F420-dependent enzyme
LADVTAEEMRELVRAAHVACLATIDSQGAPHLVPFCYALAEEGDVLFSAVDRKPKRTADLRRLHHIAADPRVCVLIDHYEDDWNRLWWVRLDGQASLLDPGTEADQALDALAAKYSQYRTDRPPGPVMRIEIGRWAGWSAV